MFSKKRKQPISNVVLYGSELFLRLLERFIKAEIQVEGEENLPKNPTLFVVNHFTRVETVLLPYIIKKLTNSMPNSLAEPSLFKGTLGNYLRAVGTLSLQAPNRNNIILGDLITGRKKWVIFPEGAMIKTKKVVRSRHFVIRHPAREGPVRTGSAYLAALSELYRREIRSAHQKGEEKRVSEYLKNFSIERMEEISPEETVIVPTNLTYFPIRPGKNIIQALASKFIKEIPERFEEELEIEGNLLFSGTSIHVSFGTPVRVGIFLDRFYFRKNEVLSSLLLFYRRHLYGVDPSGLNLERVSRRLTNHFMEKIYSMVTVNMDHLFSFGLLSIKEKKTEESLFKYKLFLACKEIQKDKKYNVHPSLENLSFELVADESHKEYDHFEALAIQGKIIRKRDSTYFINTRTLEGSHEFHNIRRENTVRVIANEIEHVKELCKIIKREFRRSRKRVRLRVAEYLCKLDQDIFQKDYERYRDKELSKPKEIGAPVYLNPGKSETGILICHGYMAAPEEVRLLGEYLAKLGYSVYIPRLKGHGTSPYNLADVTWNDWYDSFNLGYAVLKSACERVIIGGFSTGGTLALLAAANKGEHIAGLFTVNAPLQLKSIRTKLVGPIHFWNELLERFKIEEGKLEFVDNTPENPEINYTKNSIKGVRELGLLMNECRDALDRISVPALIIQEKHDPIVDPRSAAIILDNIRSKEKEVFSVEMNRHGILRREGSQEVFEKISKFVEGAVR